MLDLTILGIFFAGIMSVLSPCILPLLPSILVISTEKNKSKPILVILGLIISFMLMGIITSAFGAIFLQYIPYLQLIAAIIIIFFGVITLFDIRLFYKLSSYTSNIHIKKESNFDYFLVGLSLGVIWIPCVGPLLGTVLMIVATKGSLFYGFFLLFIYSLGFAIPMFAIVYFTQKSSCVFKNVLNYNIYIKKITGIILIITGLYLASTSQIIILF